MARRIEFWMRFWELLFRLVSWPVRWLWRKFKTRKQGRTSRKDG